MATLNFSAPGKTDFRGNFPAQQAMAGPWDKYAPQPQAKNNSSQIFEVKGADGQVYEIEGAPDEQTAIAAFKRMNERNSQPDTGKVKRNVQRMIDQNAPESEIDSYVASEGTTPEALRASANTSNQYDPAQLATALRNAHNAGDTEAAKRLANLEIQRRKDAGIWKRDNGGNNVRRTYEVSAPNGKKYRVSGQGSQEEALAHLQQQLGNEPQPAQWSDLPGNILPSAGKMAGDMWQAVSNPGETAQGVMSAITGANLNAEKAVSEYLPSWAGPVANAASYMNPITGPMLTAAKLNPAFAQRSEATADAMGDALSERYGGFDKVKNTMVTDPVGFAADASTILSGGAGLTARAPMLSLGLNIAAKATDPLAMGGKAFQKAAEGVGTVASYPLSVMTGASPDAIRTGYTAGKGGGETATAFRDNMRGKEAPETVVNDARAALDNIAEQRRGDYMGNMQSTLGSTVAVDPTPIWQAMDDLRSSLYVKSNSPSGNNPLSNQAAFPPLEKGTPQEFAALNEIEGLLQAWEAHPEGLTPAGLDALKQRIGKLQPSPMDQNANNLRRIVTVAENAVKHSIIKAVPDYGKAMADYAKSKGMTDEITKSLSLGRNASVDTTMSKLLSALGSGKKTRADNLAALEANGSANLMPRIAGQQLSEVMPRGMIGKAIGTALSGSAYFNPATIAALPLASPRFVGEIAHALGRGTRRSQQHVNPKAAIIAALLGRDQEEAAQ